VDSCPTWTGIPAKPAKPMKCGALAFLHIGKTGGTTIADHLKTHAAAGNYSYFSLYNVSGPDHSEVDLSRDAYMNDAYLDPSNLSSPAPRFEEWSEWQALSRALDGAQPRVAFQMHHGMPGLAQPGNLLETHLLPMKERLRAKGCDLTLVTVLRDGPSRALSDLAYARWMGWVSRNASATTWSDYFKSKANHETNYLVRGFLSGHDREEYSDPDSERAILPEARRALSAMDFVGRTEELDAFVSRLNVLLGLPEALVATAGNETPEEFKQKNFTDEAGRCLADTNAVDQELYQGYCED